MIEAEPAVAQHHYDLIVTWLKNLRVPEARIRQLLHNHNFGWADRMKYRFWMLRNRCAYVRNCQNYAADARGRSAGGKQGPILASGIDA